MRNSIFELRKVSSIFFIFERARRDPRQANLKCSCFYQFQANNSQPPLSLKDFILFLHLIEVHLAARYNLNHFFCSF